MKPRVRLARKFHFSAGYRYARADRSAAENQALYGDLYKQDGFGCNFSVEAHFEGEIDRDTGMIENLAEIDTWIKSVADIVDHRFLNRDVAFFKAEPPTLENIAKFCFAEIKARMGERRLRLFKVRAFEGADTWADCFACDATLAERDF